MKNISYMIGYKRWMYNQFIKVVVLGHVVYRILLGRRPWKGTLGFLKRLLFFLSKMKYNKYVKSGSATKLNLYVPAFPTKAFFKACSKVASVDKKMPCVSVLLSVTSGCRYRCEHCYQKYDIGKDVNIEDLLDVVRTLDRMGVAFFNIEGGEPFLVYERLKAVCAAVTTGEIWVNSTGDGMTRERLLELRGLGERDHVLPARIRCRRDQSLYGPRRCLAESAHRDGVVSRMRPGCGGEFVPDEER